MRDLFLLKIYQSRAQPADQRNSYQVPQVPIYGSNPHESRYFLKPHIFLNELRPRLNEQIHCLSVEGRQLCDKENVQFQKNPDLCGQGLNV